MIVIKITDVVRRKIYLNIDHIVSFQSDNKGIIILTLSDNIRHKIYGTEEQFLEFLMSINPNGTRLYVFEITRKEEYE